MTSRIVLIYNYEYDFFALWMIDRQLGSIEDLIYCFASQWNAVDPTHSSSHHSDCESETKTTQMTFETS